MKNISVDCSAKIKQRGGRAEYALFKPLMKLKSVVDEKILDTTLYTKHQNLFKYEFDIDYRYMYIYIIYVQSIVNVHYLCMYRIMYLITVFTVQHC